MSLECSKSDKIFSRRLESSQPCSWSTICHKILSSVKAVDTRLDLDLVLAVFFLGSWAMLVVTVSGVWLVLMEAALGEIKTSEPIDSVSKSSEMSCWISSQSCSKTELKITLICLG